MFRGNPFVYRQFPFETSNYVGIFVQNYKKMLANR